MDRKLFFAFHIFSNTHQNEWDERRQSGEGSSGTGLTQTQRRNFIVICRSQASNYLLFIELIQKHWIVIRSANQIRRMRHGEFSFSWVNSIARIRCVCARVQNESARKIVCDLCCCWIQIVRFMVLRQCCSSGNEWLVRFCIRVNHIESIKTFIRFSFRLLLSGIWASNGWPDCRQGA